MVTFANKCHAPQELFDEVRKPAGSQLKAFGTNHV